jgi:Protein of unknown function (DUF4079)
MQCIWDFRFVALVQQKEMRKKSSLNKSSTSNITRRVLFMVLGTIGGMASTYIENQKLFFGPHLLVGLGMTGLIAVSASLTPLMQKGSDIARNSHITINVALLSLFGWQAITGTQIVLKLLSKSQG